MRNFHKFTIKAQEALQNAQDIASQKNHGEFRAIHLLSSLIADEQSLVRPLLIKAGVNLEELDKSVEEELGKLPKIFANTSISQLYLSQELMHILEGAGKIAISQKDEFVSCEHLLLSILDIQSTAKTLLENFGLKKEVAFRILAQLRGS